MIKRLLWNEIRNHKLLSISTVIFMAISSLLIALSAVLFTDLLGSVNGLIDMAKTPDYLQMHAGEMDVESGKRKPLFWTEQWYLSIVVNGKSAILY